MDISTYELSAVDCRIKRRLKPKTEWIDISTYELSAVDCRIKRRLKPKTIICIGICCFSAKHAALRSKIARNQENVPDMFNSIQFNSKLYLESI